MGPPLQEVRPLPPHPSRLRRATFPPRGRFRRRRIRTGSVGSAKPGAVVKPHQRQFLQTQGPVAREESRKATPFLRAGNIVILFRRAPRKRGGRGPTPLVKGRWPKARGDREGEYGHKVSILSRPPAILWFLSHRWESTSPRRAKPCNIGRRNLPHRSRPTSIPCLPTLSPPCKPTVSKTKTAGWWRAARPSARLTGRR